MGAPTSQPKPQTLYCRFCREEFITYRGVGLPECPRCGRPARALTHRRLLRVVALAVLAAMIIALVLFLGVWR